METTGAGQFAVVPLGVRLVGDADGRQWLVLDLAWGDVAALLAELGVGDAAMASALCQTGRARTRVLVTQEVERLLVELVELVAEVRRAGGTVELEFEDLGG